MYPASLRYLHKSTRGSCFLQRRGGCNNSIVESRVDVDAIQPERPWEQSNRAKVRERGLHAGRESLLVADCDWKIYLIRNQE